MSQTSHFITYLQTSHLKPSPKILINTIGRLLLTIQTICFSLEFFSIFCGYSWLFTGQNVELGGDKQICYQSGRQIKVEGQSISKFLCCSIIKISLNSPSGGLMRSSSLTTLYCPEALSCDCSLFNSPIATSQHPELFIKSRHPHSTMPSNHVPKTTESTRKVRTKLSLKQARINPKNTGTLSNCRMEQSPGLDKTTLNDEDMTLAESHFFNRGPEGQSKMFSSCLSSYISRPFLPLEPFNAFGRYNFDQKPIEEISDALERNQTFEKLLAPKDECQVSLTVSQFSEVEDINYSPQLTSSVVQQSSKEQSLNFKIELMNFYSEQNLKSESSQSSKGDRQGTSIVAIGKCPSRRSNYIESLQNCKDTESIGSKSSRSVSEVISDEDYFNDIVIMPSLLKDYKRARTTTMPCFSRFR